MDEEFRSAFLNVRKQAQVRLQMQDRIDDATVYDTIERVAKGCSDKEQDVVKAVYNSMRGMDVLQPLMEDDRITEIMVNGYRNIYIEQDGLLQKTDISFFEEHDLDNLIQYIVSSVNRSVNQAHPIVDARLADGSRVHVVLPPIALDAPMLTIRKFPKTPFTMEELLKRRTLSLEAAAFLKQLVVSRHNVFISGGTGSGKTTLLNVLSGYIPDDERVVTIEDSAELRLQNVHNLVRLEKRNANDQEQGEIGIRQLIRASLRMRPDRIIVGEVRGDEAIDMLQAMNTGHNGSLSTGHANSCADMFSRLETMVLTGTTIPLEAIRNQIVSALDYMVHITRLRDRSRRITEISEVLGYKDGMPILNPIFVFREEDPRSDVVHGALVRTENAIRYGDKFRLSGMEVI